MGTSGGPDAAIRRKIALLIGYLGLTGALVGVSLDRATQYEVSIYAATTPLFWAGVAVATVVGVAVSIVSYRDRYGGFALFLVSLTMVSVFALPSLRGYYFFGHGDSLIHLGWAKDIADGLLVPTDLLYPASHLISVLLSAATGIEIRQSMLLVTLVFKLLFVVFVPLSLYVLYRDRRIVFFGVVSALLLLPVNQVSVHEHFHPFSMTVFFTPFFYYLVFAHITGHHTDSVLPDRLSPTALVLPLVSTTLVLLHPQAAFDVLLVLATIVGVRFVYRRWKPEHSVSEFRGVYGQLLVLALVFAFWASQFENTVRVFESMVTGIQNAIAGTGETAEIVQQRGESSSAVGASLFELFVKLFGVSLVYSLLTVGLVLTRFWGNLTEPVRRGDGVVVYFAYSGLVFSPYLAVHFLGDIDAYLFRQVGFAMAVVTLLGALALFLLSNDDLGSVVPFDLRPVLGTATVIALVLSLLVVFSSPYIFLPNSQVTETEMEGYQTLIEHQDDDVPILGVRVGPYRFVEALQYEEGGVPLGDSPNGTVFGGQLGGYYDGDRYLAYSAYDRQSETEVYRGLRYSTTEFRQVGAAPTTHRIQTNGDVTVYYLD